ncbi:MAG: hypothetical protein V1806_09960 [Pseudomonadota bacterium]
MASDLDITRQEKLALMDLGLHKVAVRLLLAAKKGRPEDWRLLGRSVGRVERDLQRLFNQIQDEEQLRQVADLCLDEDILETRVKSTYLFAKAHSLGCFQDAVREARVAEMLGGGAGEQGA